MGNKKILIAYGTRYGSTEEISQEIARSIRLELEVGDVEIIPDYDSEIIIIALVKRESTQMTLTSRG